MARHCVSNKKCSSEDDFCGVYFTRDEMFSINTTKRRMVYINMIHVIDLLCKSVIYMLEV